jgi:hypothetical protein
MDIEVGQKRCRTLIYTHKVLSLKVMFKSFKVEYFMNSTFNRMIKVEVK